MYETEPQIFLIGRPSLDWDAVAAYLRQVNGVEWWDRQLEAGTTKPGNAWMAAQALVEFAGRLCYRSWKPGLNPNVTKVRTDSEKYLDHLLKMAHGSVLEHANYTFVFHNVSRVFTHELVRHRVGVAISQESLRYVRLTQLGFRIPPVLEHLRQRVVDLVEAMESFQQDAAKLSGLENEGDEFGAGQPTIPFAQKKIITSALRRLAPIGLSTGLLWTANVRTLRHVLASRTAAGAEEEIRIVFHRVGEIMRQEAPLLFQDFTTEPHPDDPHGHLPPVWVPANPVAGQTRV